jgi:hypothetical protein
MKTNHLPILTGFSQVKRQRNQGLVRGWLGRDETFAR